MKKGLHILIISFLCYLTISAQTVDAKIRNVVMFNSHYKVGDQILPWVYGTNNGTNPADFTLTCKIYEDESLVFEESKSFTNIQAGKLAMGKFNGPIVQLENALITGEFIINQAGDEDPSNDTLKIYATSNTLARTRLWERFTNTSCGPCAYWEKSHRAVLDNNIDNVLPIYTHVSWPSAGDPFFVANKTEASHRRNYYSISSVPSVVLDGKDVSDPHKEEVLDNPQGAGIVIEASGSLSANPVNLKVDISCPGAVMPADNRLFAVVIENDIDFKAPNGEEHFDFTMRKFYPDVNGTPVELAKNKTVTKDLTLNLDASWVKENCEVIVFVQNMDTKEILQATKMGVNTSVEENTSIPVEYSLDQNYPNPFNPSTKISYSIPEEGFVKLDIYDVLGRKIKTLSDEFKSAGTYEVIFDGSDVSSGVYFYKLDANGYSKIKKMMLIK